jgi:hypothetical protein
MRGEVMAAINWRGGHVFPEVGSRFLSPDGKDYRLTEDGWVLESPCYYFWLGRDAHWPN